MAPAYIRCPANVEGFTTMTSRAASRPPAQCWMKMVGGAQQQLLCVFISELLLISVICKSAYSDWRSIDQLDKGF